MPAGDLLDGTRPPAPDREAHGDKQLVVGQRCLPGADEELGGPHRPHSGGPADVELGVERERNGGILGGRIGVVEGPAERDAVVADLEVADQRRGRGQERNVADFQLTLADHRTDHDVPVHPLEADETRRDRC